MKSNTAIDLKYFLRSEFGGEISFIRKGEYNTDNPFVISVWADKTKLDRPKCICINGDYGTNPSYDEMLEMAAIIRELANELA